MRDGQRAPCFVLHLQVERRRVSRRTMRGALTVLRLRSGDTGRFRISRVRSGRAAGTGLHVDPYPEKELTETALSAPASHDAMNGRDVNLGPPSCPLRTAGYVVRGRRRIAPRRQKVVRGRWHVGFPRLTGASSTFSFAVCNHFRCLERGAVVTFDASVQGGQTCDCSWTAPFLSRSVSQTLGSGLASTRRNSSADWMGRRSPP